MTGATHVKILILVLLGFSCGNAAELRFTSSDRVIINSVIKQYQRECSHISILDGNKLKEIQNLFQDKKDSMTEEIKSCYGEIMSQLVGTHSIYDQTCNEVTPKKNFGNDKALARIFINVKKYGSGIRPFHEKLNDCLLRKGSNSKDLISYSDYESNGRIMSKKIRDINIQMPFRENSLDYR